MQSQLKDEIAWLSTKTRPIVSAEKKSTLNKIIKKQIRKKILR